MSLDVMYSHKSDEWETPQSIFNELDAEFNFNLDPCSTDENHKCKEYYTKKDNGLNFSWGGKKVFVNPPYSEISKWVEKSFYESRHDNTIVVLLIPARTDTRYFHNYILHRAEVRFLKGRLKFEQNGKPGNSSAPFPTMVVVFRGAVKEK